MFIWVLIYAYRRCPSALSVVFVRHILKTNYLLVCNHNLSYQLRIRRRVGRLRTEKANALLSFVEDSNWTAHDDSTILSIKIKSYTRNLK